MRLSLDVETFSPTDIAAGTYRYAEDADLLMLAYAFDDAPVKIWAVAEGEAMPADLADAIENPNVVKCAWNAAFERAILRATLGLTCPPEQWQCAMVQAACAGLPASLDECGKALGIERPKLDIGKKLIRKFCVPRTPTLRDASTRNVWVNHRAEWEAFKEYCIRDVEAEREIWHRLEPCRLPAHEWALWHIDQHINDTGVLIDVPLAEAAVAVDETLTEQLTARAREITGLENPNSREQMLTWLRAHGVDAPDLTAETVQDLSERTSGAAGEVLSIRAALARSASTKYSAALRSVCRDGRMRGVFQFAGAGRTARWAGRLIQPQNLPRPPRWMESWGDEDYRAAREMILSRDVGLMQMCYPDLQALLGAMTRTLFRAPEGTLFAVSDFAAIEARVLAWVAGEDWVLQAFREGRDIYKATAAQMLGKDYADVTKADRQRGKVATLALGYAGGVKALEAMGALKMGMGEDELKPIVAKWRKANKRIVALWRDLEDACRAALEGGVHRVGPVRIGVKGDWLQVELPSKRRLNYYRMRIEDNQLTFDGVDGYTRKFGPVRTYSGKLCIAEGTPVLTLVGWKPIERVTAADQVWDGDNWVACGGAIAKGEQTVIKAHGAWMTSDHEVLTEAGWKRASQSERYNRRACRLPDGHQIPRFVWREVAVGRSLRVRYGETDGPVRIYEATEARDSCLLRVQTQANPPREEEDSRHVVSSGFRSMAKHVRPLPSAVASSLAQLRWARDNGLRALAGVFRELLGGHGADLCARAYLGPHGQRDGVLAGELPLGVVSGAGEQHPENRAGGNPGRSDNRERVFAPVRRGAINGVLPLGARSCVARTGREARYHAEVFDILDCGPQRRFVIATEAGHPLIVHNCENLVQAIARDCLAETLQRLHAEGIQAVMHIHDEVVCEGADANALSALMGHEIYWAPGLPLSAEAWSGAFYRKD